MIHGTPSQASAPSPAPSSRKPPRPAPVRFTDWASI